MSVQAPQSANHDQRGFPATGGEMGERIRAFDWAKTPVGPADAWPQSLRTVIRIMLDSRYAMWLGWGPDFTFFYNDAYARMTLGPKHPWALGRPAREVWAEIWADIGPRAESVVRTGQATWDEGLLLFIERLGFPEETYHTFSYSPVPDDEGGIGGMLCVVTEDTERTIGERRLRTLRELAERTSAEAKSVDDACASAVRVLAENPYDVPFALIYLLDDHTARLACATGLEEGSPAALRSIALTDVAGGWPLSTVLKSGHAEVVADLDKRFEPLRTAPWPEPTRQAVVVPLARPGQTRPAGFVVAGISPRLVFNDGYQGFLYLLAGHVATAIANARAYEEERRRAEALAELDRAKTAFFSNVSHEFRTPLTLMLGPVEELLNGTQPDLPPAAQEQLEVVNRNGLRLLRLVNTLLDFSRIEAGRVRAVFEPTDLANFTAELASNFRSACERAGLHLVVDCPSIGEPVYVDRQMWEKIVLNLLSNAFKFTLQGEIAVALRPVGRTVELSVRDTGTGIPAAEMPRLFERFHRVQNARGRTHEGSGIGLALVQELAKLHGGSIAAESVVDQGTTFTVTLPLGTAHLPADQLGRSRNLASTVSEATPFVEEALRWLPDAGESRHEPGGGGQESQDRSQESGEVSADNSGVLSPDLRPRILVADDNADMRQYIARLLAPGHRVEMVADGAAALATALDRPPDLVLSDVMMPRLDGFGLLRELRADPRTRNLPVILLSARAGEESRVEGMQAGADDYLVKPFSARELLARVSAHLQMARLRREASESLRASEERLRMALTSARMVAWQYHPAEDRVVVSDNAAEVFGLPPGTTIENAREGFALIHPEDADEHRARIAHVVAEGGSFQCQFRMIRPDNGAIMWMEERGHAVADPSAGPVRVVGVVIDITERKHAEEALREADRRKDEFLAMLAHELRNPLAPVRNALHILRVQGLDEATVGRTRQMMERQVEHLVRLVDDLMDVSRIMRGKIVLRKEPVQMAAVVARAAETAQPIIDAQGHELTIELPPESLVIEGDLIRLSQVVSNLLTNAAKYTEKAGQIWLTAERTAHDVIIRVRDNGLGIPAEMLPKVFDLFMQAERSLDRSQGGLGIGLTLVKRLVEMHHGSVTAFSEGPGKGSTFSIRLPLLHPATQQRSRAGGKPGQSDDLPTLPRRRILIVDDNVDAAESLAMMLRLWKQEVRVAHEGNEALAVAHQFRPDMAILDIGLPGMSGYEVASRLREQPEGADMLLIAVTGYGQEEDRRRSLEAGLNYHLTKPVNLENLEQLIASVPRNGKR